MDHSTRELPLLFREVCEFFKVPRIGLVKVERLGNWLNRTEGTVAQTETKPLFSLMAPGPDPQPGIKLA